MRSLFYSLEVKLTPKTKLLMREEYKYSNFMLCVFNIPAGIFFTYKITIQESRNPFLSTRATELLNKKSAAVFT